MRRVAHHLARVPVDVVVIALGTVTAVWTLLILVVAATTFSTVLPAVLAIASLRLLVPLERLRLRLVGVRVSSAPEPEHPGAVRRAVRVLVGPIDGDDVIYLLVHGVLGTAAGFVSLLLWGGAVLGIVDGGWERALPGGGADEWWIRVVAVVVLLPLAVAEGRLIVRGQARLARERFDGQARRRLSEVLASRARAVDAQAVELRRIERDLHDGAQARIVALSMHVGAARRALRGLGDDADPARAHLDSAAGTATAALEDLRRLVRGIHPPVLVDRGLAAALRVLSADSALPVDLDVDTDLEPPVPDGPDRLPAPVASAAYFTAAEALANAAKHAGANRCRIAAGLSAAAGHLVVVVTDDGGGGADPAGAGLTGLRHRVEAIDGTLTVSGAPGGGTTVSAMIPLPRPVGGG